MHIHIRGEDFAKRKEVVKKPKPTIPLKGTNKPPPKTASLAKRRKVVVREGPPDVELGSLDDTGGGVKRKWLPQPGSIFYTKFPNLRKEAAG